MIRLGRLNNLKSHPWYGPQLAKLKAPELQAVVEFIQKNEGLGASEFAQAVNLLGGCDSRSSLIAEILTVVNREERK